MEYSVVDSTTLETTIDIDEETTVQEESFTETIEISHDLNITVDNNKDPLDLSTEIDEKFSIRPCYIHVERCDKIWETMKLIRELQSPASDSNDSNDDDYLDDDDDETMDSPLNDEESNSSETHPALPYIKYQPVLGNGNTALPNFQFSVKSTRALYQCNTCGRQYRSRKTLREHSERNHNIILPPIRRPPKYKTGNFSKIPSTDEKSNETPDDEESNQSTPSYHESGSTISSTPSEEKERLLDSTSETQDSEYLSPSGKIRHYGTCKHCSKVLSDKYYLKVHETLIHGVVSSFSHGSGPQVLRNYVAKTKDIFNCDHCDYAFYGFDKLTEHKQIIHGITSETFSTTSSSMSNDKSGSINGRKQVATKKPANSSLKTFKQTESIKLKSLKSKTPIKSSLPRGKYQPKKSMRTCEACGKLYSNDTNWKVHLITVHGIVPPTTISRKTTFTNNSLGSHKCKYCNKRFSYATTLRNHVILQHIKDQISSQKTSKNQKTSQGLQRKPLLSSSSKPTLTAFKLQTSPNPHKPPPKLTKIFPQESETSKAMIYNCTACCSTYCSRQSLLYHMANVHQIYQTHTRKARSCDIHKPHKCKGCHERFWNQKNLYMHQLIFHGIRDMTTKPTKRVHLANKRTGIDKPRSRNLKIERPPQLTAVRSLRDKQRLNYDEAELMNEKDIYKTPMTPVTVSKVKIEGKEGKGSSKNDSDPSEPLIQCILCNRHCKKIKKHFIEFHKVRNPEILISQCKISSINPVTIKKEVKPIQIKKEPDDVVIPVRKRRPVDSMRRTKPMTVPPPDALFEILLKILKGRKRRLYCCKLCRFMSYGYETTKKHCKIHHPEEIVASGSLETSEAVEEQLDVKMAPIITRRRSEGQLISRKRRRESLDEREIQKRRISSAFGGELRMTRAVKRLKQELEHKCENCERIFRNSDILAAHKVSCKGRTFESGESNDTRESSDRDSGIGISITIKKKNDSYEIVSRDSSGERPSKKSQLDGYSDSSDTRHSLGFNHEYRLIKLEKMDDDDREVDFDDSEGFRADELETVDAVEDPPPGQILSLRDLCRRALGHTRQVPKVRKKGGKMMKTVGSHQCKVCKSFWPSIKGRNTHCWKAHKVSAAEGSNKRPQIDTLRNLCISVLENHGDKEARKKVWFPCHICNTVWPTIKSRRGHVNSHGHEWRKI